MRNNIINLFKAIKARTKKQLDPSKIPSGPYCRFEVLGKPFTDNTGKNDCPYATILSNKITCLYTGYVGNDLGGDKICNENL